jgi:UDP-N-acetylmuramoyl-L-alanyl-D-glutamate--2,6-diaminopimelate ligase
VAESAVNSDANSIEKVAREVLGWLGGVAPSVFADRRDLHVDSRYLKQGDVFVALRGERFDGRDFVHAAADAGAAAALVEAEGWAGNPSSMTGSIPILAVNNLRVCLGLLAAEFYRRPSEHLLSIGVTGTNGKTSSTQWIAQLLTQAGRRCAVIGTIGIGFIDESLVESPLTTPDPVSLQREVRALLDAGAQAIAMEASSIALGQGRLNGMKVDVALFTNLTRDHLDYHGTMQQYEAAKSFLFDWPTLSHAVINLDDAAGRRLIPKLAHRGVAVTGYSITDTTHEQVSHRLIARAIRATPAGLAFEAELDGDVIPIEVPLVGQFNVQNLLGVLGVIHACGIDFVRAASALPKLQPPPGRMQQVAVPDAPLAVIDYAHTPDALAKALEALRPLVKARAAQNVSGRLWVVFGAGGDRDAGKRAPMGAVAAQGADVVVVTSDNPRSESAHAIASQVAAGAAGASALITVVDRSRAIDHAITNAGPADVVLIAGKGHESYQIVGAEKLPFSDLAHARAALARRAGAAGAACRH